MTETRTLVHADLAEPEIVPFAGGTVALFASRSPDKEAPNEDALGLIPLGKNAGVLVVADGAGGMPGGDEASSIAVDRLARAVTWEDDEPDALRARIVDGIEAANASILELGRGAATTIAVAEIRDGIVRSYHVGDSMILVTGQRGRTKYQTVSHSPVGYAVEAGMMDETEAIHHEERHVVSNMLGSPGMRIEIGPAIAFAPRDTLCLASDGLTDNLFLAEIVEQVRKGPLSRAASSLVETCHRRMARPDTGRPSKPDDLSFLVFRPRP